MRNSMAIFPINLEEGVRDFTWSADSLLASINSSAPTKEIFQTVCNEIGQFYQLKGFKYSPSARRLEYKYQDFKCKIQFSSSHYNMAGKYVLMEINTGIYPLQLEKQYKAAKESVFPIILPNVNLLDEVIPGGEPGKVIGISIFGETNEIKDTRYTIALRKHARSANIYNIDIDNFKKILKYINGVVCYSFKLVTDQKELAEYINSSFGERFYWLKDKRFVDYLNLYHSKDSDPYIAFLNRYKELEGKEFA